MRLIPKVRIAFLVIACTVLWVACAIQGAYACNSCGSECAAACGTRHFRTCCFNYLRKRSGPPPSVEGLTYNNPRMARDRFDDNLLHHMGIPVYRGFLGDDSPAYANNKLSDPDFDVEYTKPSNENPIRMANDS